MKSANLTRNILIGMVLGAALGVVINMVGPATPGFAWLVDGVFPVVGRIFVKSLQLLVVPLVLLSLICGTASLNDVRRLGRIGLKTVAFYLATTAIAVSTAIVLAVLIRPGDGLSLDYTAEFAVRESPPLTEVIMNVFPSNPFASMAEGNMLQIIVFAILFGVATCLAGEPGQRVLRLANDLNDIVMKLVMLLMQIAPFGVFALVARTFAAEGLPAILALGKYFFLVVGVLLVHLFVTYGLLFRVCTGLSVRTFMRKVRKVQLFAFSTASSNATLPLTLETVEHRLGVKPAVGAFTIPLGATINMDGTAILQGVATVFIAQALNVDIGVQGYLMVVLMATLSSIGTAGVPGVGLIMLAMVFQQVGLPVAAIGVIYGVDRLLDMVRTAVNVSGDCVVSVIVAKSEGEFDFDAFASVGDD
ncbi:dicarboxylate/amino acid:cation symporter [Actomonas aquatica]|uniref:Dicarboxylate/amino acid:cation symporter n=1 Tax=Actomonas aquatica TaxID=2866162 RepID=A0ABZ1CBL4_9BACT|nr:dicarboxylate/amino acid:cation symporter [Opitutus sp. WL0086]WRQ89066.1 dicarboxylate/amino acid:cation symporter [Opitutus sp. WL0086]